MSGTFDARLRGIDMPTAREILTSLRLAANDFIALSVAWHAAVFALVLAFSAGFRPTRRTTGLLLVSPLASTAVVAFVSGNPFNGVVFGVLTLTLTAVASRLKGSIELSQRSVNVVAWLMIGFGLFYPHFLEGRPPATYLVAAAVGVIPCPTLSVVVGLSLLCGGLTSRAWAVTLGLAGSFYGLFGVLRLAVGLDIVLLAGSLVLLAAVLPAQGLRGKPGDAKVAQPTGPEQRLSPPGA